LSSSFFERCQKYLDGMVKSIIFGKRSLENCRAKWGGSGSLFPKSALCGAEFPQEGIFRRRKGSSGMLRSGPRATAALEPRQVRKEAAVRGDMLVCRGIIWTEYRGLPGRWRIPRLWVHGIIFRKVRWAIYTRQA